MSWSTFLRAQWGAIAAMDFFTVEVLTLVGLVRYHVLFVIDLASRRVHVAGIVPEPYDDWIRQIARNLTDAVDGFLLPHRYVIMDRAPVFTAGFRALLAGGGVESIRLHDVELIPASYLIVFQQTQLRGRLLGQHAPVQVIAGGHAHLDLLGDSE